MCTLPAWEVLRLGETEVLKEEPEELEELEDLEEEEDFLVDLEVEDLEVFDDLEEEEEEEDFLGDLEVDDLEDDDLEEDDLEGGWIQRVFLMIPFDLFWSINLWNMDPFSIGLSVVFEMHSIIKFSIRILMLKDFLHFKIITIIIFNNLFRCWLWINNRYFIWFRMQSNLVPNMEFL